MAHAWFLYNGNNSGDGPTDPSNYNLVRMQPDFISGSEIGAIYAEIQIIASRIKPYISAELHTEISVAKFTSKPSSNVLLKNV